MKLFFKAIILFFFAAAGLTANAQTSQTSNKAILDELMRDTPGKGTVRIYEDENIKEILGRSMAPPRTVYATRDGSVQYVKMRGFKIQAFSGNNQRTSKNEAYQKQGLVNTAFPEHETIVSFDSPFWRLRVGNFKSREDANAALRTMKGAFPAFGKEMYIVVDEVKIPVSELQPN